MVRAIDEIEYKILKALSNFKEPKDLDWLVKTLKMEQEKIGSRLIRLEEDGFLAMHGTGSFSLTDLGKETLEKMKLKQELFKKKLSFSDLHPAGGILHDIGFVYEPISHTDYAYNWLGKKGIATVTVDPDSKKYYFKVGNATFWLKEPLEPDDLIFNLPTRGVVQDWADGKKIPLETKDLWLKVRNHFKVFLDLSEECFYDLLALSVFQSWFRDLLKSCWFVSIEGAFAAGKTTIGEALVELCRHGYSVGNYSEAFVGRAYHKLKITPFFDEFDSIAGTEDSKIYEIVRTAQRRGMKYSRTKAKGEKFASYETFGPTFFSVHGEIERALLTRNMIIITEESQDEHIPITNFARKVAAQRLYDELFIWYMENIINYKIVDIVDIVDVTYGILKNNIDNNVDTKQIRANISKQFLLTLNDRQLSQLRKLRGRSAEICFVMCQLINQLGLQDLDIDLSKLFEIREERLEEAIEIGRAGVVRDLLVNLFKKLGDLSNYRTSAGEFMISNLELRDEINKYLKRQKESAMTPAELKGILRDLGFSEARKKMKIATLEELEAAKPEVTTEPLTDKELLELACERVEKRSRLCNIFTPKVCRKLGIEYDAEEWLKLHKKEKQKTLGESNE
ncbi:MAG: hypothetical protein ACTSVW_00430 [Candidatus Njordarchaeales archaeon]